MQHCWGYYMPGQHVRFIEKRSGYSVHGTFIRETFTGKCLVKENSWSHKVHKLKAEEIEWLDPSHVFEGAPNKIKPPKEVAII